jgi:hypothetical protein
MSHAGKGDPLSTKNASCVGTEKRGSICGIHASIAEQSPQHDAAIRYKFCSKQKGPVLVQGLERVVGRTRFELVTNGLKVRCSTN